MTGCETFPLFVTPEAPEVSAPLRRYSPADFYGLTVASAAYRVVQVAWLTDRVAALLAEGNAELAAECKADAEYVASLPVAVRPPVVHHCDSCGRVVTGKARLAKYFETRGVDWVHCARCEVAANV